VGSNLNGYVRGVGGITVGPALLDVTDGWGWTGISTVGCLTAGTSLQLSGTLTASPTVTAPRHMSCRQFSFDAGCLDERTCP
jgi:hypothetical protein